MHSFVQFMRKKERFCFSGINVLLSTRIIFMLALCYFANPVSADTPKFGDVYFGVSSAVISQSSLNTIKQHAQFLNSNPRVKLTLYGHADARGSREANLILGEARVQAVMKALIAEGVNKQQLKLISLGEELQLGKGNSQKALRQSRRVVFYYP